MIAMKINSPHNLVVNLHKLCEISSEISSECGKINVE